MCGAADEGKDRDPVVLQWYEKRRQVYTDFDLANCYISTPKGYNMTIGNRSKHDQAR
jgi:hypothetical protein